LKRLHLAGDGILAGEKTGYDLGATLQTISHTRGYG